MRNDDWTDRLRRRLENDKADVPEMLWDDIEKRLDGGRGALRGRFVRRVVALSVAAAVAIAIVVVSGIATDSSSDGSGVAPRVTVNVVRKAVIDNVGNNKCEAGVERNDSESPQPPILFASLATSKDVLENSEVANDAAKLAVEHEETGVRTATCDTVSHVEVESKGNVLSSNDAEELLAENTPSTMWRGDDDFSRHAISRWNVEAHLSGGMEATSNSQYPVMMMAPKQMYEATEAGDEGSSSGFSTMGYPLLLSRYGEKKHHAQPFSCGISVGYALMDRLSLTTGVVYMRAVSDFYSSVGSDQTVATQRLHYIGVPLGVRYRVWGTRLLKVYGMMGVEADFNVSATVRSGGVTTDVKKDHPLFSVSAAAGVQFNALSWLGIYAEPGVKRYFDNNSSLETIFKDQPWAFNLQVGLRFDF